MNCLGSFRRLHQRGKPELAYASILVRFAVAQIRDGRQGGGKLNVRDVLSKHAQQKK